MNIDQLNAEFGIAGQLRFINGKGDLAMIAIDNDQASALISVYAGQLLSYRPAGEPYDLMFLSDKAYYQPGKAIKGGVPVCWPWFGADPEGLGRPAHGFVRNRPWQVLNTEACADGATRVTLGLSDDADTRSLWPQAFDLSLTITVGTSLSLELATRNKGLHPFVISQALHTYFAVGDIGQTRVLGLADTNYLDKVDGGTIKTQSGAVTIDAEVDRIYTDVAPALVIEDDALERRIHIDFSGSETAVVWNPWAKIAAEMADLDDDDYRRFLCVETVNAADDVITVPDGEECRLVARYRVERD
jgi:glucose-6-phosphate 1-epimerase